MNKNSQGGTMKGGRMLLFALLLLLLLPALAQELPTPEAPAPLQNSEPGKVYLLYADSLLFNKKISPDYQVLKGNVRFRRDSMFMYCDSAYFYEGNNSFDAFGNVRMQQGDTLFVYSDLLYYDGNTELAELRENVRLINREVTLYTDSLNYDQSINVGYYFEGGKIIDAQNQLTSRYGQYSPDTKQSVFQYEVVLTNPRFVLTSDTLEYNTDSKIADILGPSVIVSDSNTIYSSLGWYNTQEEQSMLLNRSLVVSKDRQLTGDTIFYNRMSGLGEVFGNMQLNDTLRKVILEGQYGFYNELTEAGLATDSALLIDYQGIDTAFVHADTFKMYNDTLRTLLPQLPEVLSQAKPTDTLSVDTLDRQRDTLSLASDTLRLSPDSLSRENLTDSLGNTPFLDIRAADSAFQIKTGDTLTIGTDSVSIDALSVDSALLLQPAGDTLRVEALPHEMIPDSLSDQSKPTEHPQPHLSRETLPLTIETLISVENDTARHVRLSLSVFRPDTLLTGLIPDSLIHLYTKNDTLYTEHLPQPKEIEAVRDSISRKIIAYYGVRFIRGVSQGVCDSLAYVPQDSVMRMYRNPVLWNNNQQIFGDSILIYFNDSTINWVHIPTSSFSARELDSLYFDQLSGTELKAFFLNGEMHQVDVSGNLEIIYYPQNRDSTYIGLCSMMSSHLRMYMKNQVMERMVLSPQTQGVLTPLSQVTPGMYFLPRYVWYDYRRPRSRSDLYQNVPPRPGEDHSGGGDFFKDDYEDEEPPVSSSQP